MDGGDGGDKDLCFYLYVNANLEDIKDGDALKNEIPSCRLEAAIRATSPQGPWRVTRTSCGLLAAFTFEIDATSLLKTPLADSLGCPVQVARLSSKDPRHKQSLTLRDVPWAVPIQEIRTCLEYQGIFPVNVERMRQNIKVELNDPYQYENLLRYGLDFLGATRFMAVPEKWRSSSGRRPLAFDQLQQDSILQCYRCQGFWHIAANCNEMPRCVRCGDNHSVETCPRPRQEPVCCHCNGPHHAAYRNCPVRIRLAKSYLLPIPPTPTV